MSQRTRLSDRYNVPRNMAGSTLNETTDQALRRMSNRLAPLSSSNSSGSVVSRRESSGRPSERGMSPRAVLRRQQMRTSAGINLETGSVESSIPVPGGPGSFNYRRASSMGDGSVRNIYEEYQSNFIGNTRIPKFQGEVIRPNDIEEAEKEDKRITNEGDLVNAIKKALGKKKKPYIYRNIGGDYSYPHVLWKNSNSTLPVNAWSTDEITAYRMNKMKV